MKLMKPMLFGATMLVMAACGGNSTDANSNGNTEGNSAATENTTEAASAKTLALAVSDKGVEGSSAKYVKLTGDNYTFEFTPNDLVADKCNGSVSVTLNVAKNPALKDGDNVFGESSIIFLDADGNPIEGIAFEISNTKELGNALLNGADALTVNYLCSLEDQKEVDDLIAKAKSFTIKVDERVYVPTEDNSSVSSSEAAMNNIESAHSSVDAVKNQMPATPVTFNASGDPKADGIRAAELEHAVSVATDKEEREKAKANLAKYKKAVKLYYSDNKAEQEKFDAAYIAKKKELRK